MPPGSNTLTPPHRDYRLSLHCTIKDHIRLNPIWIHHRRTPTIHHIELLALPDLKRHYFRPRWRRDNVFLTFVFRHYIPFPPTRICPFCMLIPICSAAQHFLTVYCCSLTAGADFVGIGSCFGGVAVEGREVEESSHESPTRRHIRNIDCRTRFANIPECPHWREWVGEGVVFIQYCAENLELCELASHRVSFKDLQQTCQGRRDNIK